MSLKRPSPPTLLIPDTARSPAGNSPTNQTGRPPLWTKSAQRKMSRLYLYTTLPINKILELIYADSPHAAPGKDSANKKLNAMLDKEPRWLHPKTNTDMGRRVAELSNSPTRSPLSSSSPFGRPHSFSDPTNHSAGPSFRLDVGRSPAGQSLSPIDPWAAPASAPPSGPFANFNGNHVSFFPGSGQGSRETTSSPGDGLGIDQADHLDLFLRRTTFMSNSTDHSTGTFHRLLPNYPDSYVKTVRRLVKRFTMPNHNRRSVSPISERPEQLVTSWLEDDDAPSVFRDRPFPLPGDFLNLDVHLQQQACHPESDAHLRKQCLCFVMDMDVSPWVSAFDITPDARRLLNFGLQPSDITVRDAFGNTILHFLVARGSVGLVLHALQTGLCASIINEKNSAGQTFLHLATQAWIQNYDYLRQLLEAVRSLGFKIYAKDHYGRNFFHVLCSEEIDLTPILGQFDYNQYAKRDAFNIVPTGSNTNTSSDAMQIDPPASQFNSPMDHDISSMGDITNEARLLQYVRAAQDKPQLEDEEGRNGLHCLAMATLSMRNVSNKAGISLAPATPEGSRRKSQSLEDKLDSSEDRLRLRQDLASGLIESGVDLNHYDHQGNTPLMAFVAELPEDDDYKLTPKIIEMLVEKGANVHARNRAGETALHIAVRCGRKLAVRTLAKSGANVHVRDAARRSALDVTDIKLCSSNSDNTEEYAHFEACRAWLSGQGYAVQHPTLMQEWGVNRS